MTRAMKTWPTQDPSNSERSIYVLDELSLGDALGPLEGRSWDFQSGVMRLGGSRNTVEHPVPALH